MFGRKKTIGLIEDVTLENGKTFKAKIDTGADSSSIDKALLKNQLGDKKINSYKIVQSALGKHKRGTVIIEVDFKGQHFRRAFSVSDRSKLKYKILIGQDILKAGGFIIDPNK